MKILNLVFLAAAIGECSTTPEKSTRVNTPLTHDRELDGMDISSVLPGDKSIRKRKKPLFFYCYFHDPICVLQEDNWHDQ